MRFDQTQCKRIPSNNRRTKDLPLDGEGVTDRWRMRWTETIWYTFTEKIDRIDYWIQRTIVEITLDQSVTPHPPLTRSPFPLRGRSVKDASSVNQMRSDQIWCKRITSNNRRAESLPLDGEGGTRSVTDEVDRSALIYPHREDKINNYTCRDRRPRRSAYVGFD